MRAATTAALGAILVARALTHEQAVLGDHEFLRARDEDAQLNRGIAGQLANLVERELGREPHADGTHASNLVERKPVRDGQMRTDLEGNPDLGGHLHGTEALHEHRAPRRCVTPRVEIKLRLSREPDLVVIDDGHGEKALLGVARLLDRGRELARDHRLAASVVQRRNVHHMSARTLCGPRAHGVRRPCADAGAARTDGGKLFAILGTGKATGMVGGQGSLGQIVEGLGANAVQLREPDANPLVELDVEPRKNIRSRTKAIDMSAHVLFGDGLRASRFDLGPARHTANLGKLALRRAGKGEGDLERLADAQANRALNLDARLEGVVLEGFLRAAHAEHTVARTHALHARIELNPHAALLVEGEVGYRLGGMALPRPKLEDITD